jgi:hypothetical protein
MMNENILYSEEISNIFYCVTLLMVTLIFFQIFIIIGIGSGWLNYKDYNWFPEVIIIANFIQIIGLTLIVFKFLFNREK